MGGRYSTPIRHPDFYGGCGTATRHTPHNGCEAHHTVQTKSQRRCFVFAKSGQLAGLEVYSMDGECNVSQLPDVDRLLPMPDAENA